MYQDEVGRILTLYDSVFFIHMDTFMYFFKQAILFMLLENHNLVLYLVRLLKSLYLC